MEPTTIVIIFVLVMIIGGIIAEFQRSKKLAEDPTNIKIDKLEKENYPVLVQEYKLEELDGLRSSWLENQIEFPDPEFRELTGLSTQDEDGSLSSSRGSIDLNLKFHGHEEHVGIVIECYHNLGNIMHIYSKNQPLLDAFTEAYKQAKQTGR